MRGSPLDVTLNPGVQPECRRPGGVRAGYTDDADRVAATYYEAGAAGKLTDLPEELKRQTEQVFQFIDSVIFSDAKLHKVDDGRKCTSARGSQDRGKYDVVADYKLITMIGRAA